MLQVVVQAIYRQKGVVPGFFASLVSTVPRGSRQILRISTSKDQRGQYYLTLKFISMEHAILKQAAGIDIAMESFEVCLATLNTGGMITYSKSLSFSNDSKGFLSFNKWLKATIKTGVQIWCVMEATGVYYESLAYYLSAQEYQLSVVLPTRMKHYQKSLEIKSKTDQLDAKVLARLGLERTLQPWRAPSEQMLQIKMLSREYRDNKQKLSAIKNQLHAKGKAHNVNAATVDRLQAQVTLLELQCHQIQKELQQLIAKDEKLKHRIQKLQTIPAAGFMTIITILAETNGFALISSQKQLISYAGMDIMLNESGQMKRRSKMSKRGNKFIRHAVHMPALCAVQHNKELKKFYQHLVERKKAKKIALTAVSRKLLCLIYTLWKKDECYQKQYHPAKPKKEEGLQEPLFTGCSLVENN